MNLALKVIFAIISVIFILAFTVVLTPTEKFQNVETRKILSEDFEIVDIAGSSVTIKNTGSEELSDIEFTIGGNNISYQQSSPLMPGETRTFVLNEQEITDSNSTSLEVFSGNISKKVDVEIIKNLGKIMPIGSFVSSIKSSITSVIPSSSSSITPVIPSGGTSGSSSGGGSSGGSSSACGNRIVEQGEICDGTVGGATCITKG